MNAYQYITSETKDRVGIICLNRPEKRNAFHPVLIQEFQAAITHFESDQAIRVIIVKAAGEAFSAGADLAYLQQLQDYSLEENRSDSAALAAFFKQIYTSPKIIIAQVEGHALAGGCGLATICDFCFAIPGIKMGYTEVKIGFIPAIVMVFLLKKISGLGVRELLLTGKIINSEEAEKIGLINKLYNKEIIDQAVFEFATELAQNCSPQAIATTKKMLAELPGMSLDQGLEYAANCNAEARQTDDCKKGIRAFLEREKLVW